jgi:hypothetical protein
MIAAQQEYSFNEARANAVLWGRIVENAVGAHLLNHSIVKITNFFIGEMEARKWICNKRAR